MKIRYHLEEINTQDPEAIADLVISLHKEAFPGEPTQYIKERFEAVCAMFQGNYKGYQPMDTLYHDLEHTLQTTLCFVRLMVNRHHAQVEPIISVKDFSLGLIAILLHDTGYLKEEGDDDGTGAKYTHNHEIRSCRHARKYLKEMGWSEQSIIRVENLINCTGPKSDISMIDFPKDADRILGNAVCTADFIGQMSDPGYVEKLPVLFQEFSESYDFQGFEMQKRDYQNYDELLKKTPIFWNVFVKDKMTNECENIWQYFKDPETGENPYIELVEKNIAIIDKKLKEIEKQSQAS